MKRVPGAWLLVTVVVMFLAACGPVRKSVFPPLVTVQQLHASSNGQWRMQLRIQNNSYQGVKFTHLQLAMQVRGTPAGTLDTPISRDIPALSVDVAEVRLTPSAAAAKALLDGGDSVPYQLVGTLTGTPDEGGKPRTFKVHSEQHWLSPMPGIPDTWR